MPKTPKPEKKSIVGLQTPSKSTSTKNIARTPTSRDLRNENKELKRNASKSKERLTAKKEVREQNKTLDKSK